MLDLCSYFATGSSVFCVRCRVSDTVLMIFRRLEDIFGVILGLWPSFGRALGLYLRPEEKKLPKLGQVNWKARSGKIKVRSGKLKVRSGWNQS